MPNWCQNTVTITANNTEQKSILSKVAKAAAERKQIFSIFRPMPLEVYRGDLGREEREKYGALNGYDWSMANWGVKLDAEATVDLFDGESLSLSFETAWTAPIALYEYLSQLGFSVDADYYEPGLMFAGVWVNGDDRYYEEEDLTEDFLENDDDGMRLEENHFILNDLEDFED